MQTSKLKLMSHPPRGIDDMVAKLSEHAVQAQREAAAQAEEAQREANEEEGMQRIAVSKEKLQRFIQTNVQLKGAGVYLNCSSL